MTAGVRSVYRLLLNRVLELDIRLVHGINQNPATRALVAGLVHFARETNCQPIGEGVETEAQRQTLVGLGVIPGQGGGITRAPLATWCASLAARGFLALEPNVRASNYGWLLTAWSQAGSGPLIATDGSALRADLV